eukprot:CAMPEP_0172070404 /NCGR_PEP_ID=MMETSP1043-20130122/13245_1 /TAXON_ID=464988 /ORGANISM="Hemiselmis andersenii, Strain CCMP441" /LENGTH=58 /DNA_ID=CAMNT_0012730765 /DNA_START=66 /DNA_END=239 /DNA_ORIENTATION=-
MRGIHIVGAERQRENALLRVMDEYDSSEELNDTKLVSYQNKVLTYMHPTLDEQQQHAK